MIRLVECPRDAMQGIKPFIPTEDKLRYLKALLKVGFDTLDCGSFVSPRAVPQMKDTKEIIPQLDLSNTATKLLTIVANKRGAEYAVDYDEISYLGFPFSISETFQKRNTNSSIEESFERVEAIKKLCDQHGKELVIYISMAFGNPYDEKWHPDIPTYWCDRLYKELGVNIFALSDTIGVSNFETITNMFSTIIPEFEGKATIGAHLHTTPDSWREKVDAAYKAGCHRFDGAIKGFGGCPMAKDDLTGNMATENIIQYFIDAGVETGINKDEFSQSMQICNEVIPH